MEMSKNKFYYLIQQPVCLYQILRSLGPLVRHSRDPNLRQRQSISELKIIYFWKTGYNKQEDYQIVCRLPHSSIIGSTCTRDAFSTRTKADSKTKTLYVYCIFKIRDIFSIKKFLTKNRSLSLFSMLGHLRTFRVGSF